MQKKKHLSLITLLPFLLVVAAYELIPIINTIVKSFQKPKTGGFTFENYEKVFSTAVYQVSIKNSITLALFVSFVGLVIAFVISLAYHKSSRWAQGIYMPLLNVTSQFAGIPLAFAYILMLGSSGFLAQLAREIGFSPIANFNLYSVQGLRLVFIYFQIPFAALLLLPAFHGVQKELEEAATLLGASSLQFWLKVGVPMLLPSIMGTFSTLIANSLVTYATPMAITDTNYHLLTIIIISMFTGEARPREELGTALTVVLMLMMAAAIILNNLVLKYNLRKGGLKSEEA